MPLPHHSLVLLRITKLVPNPIYRGFARYFTPEHGILPLYKPTFPTRSSPQSPTPEPVQWLSRSSPQKAAAFYSAVSGV